MSIKPHHGSCYCKTVRFIVKGALRPVVYCHCSQCRKITGHYMAASGAKRGDVAIEGTPRWFTSSEDIERGFCPICGTNLFWSDMRRDTISIAAGALDDATLHAQSHIYVKDKADYYPICDGLPQFEQNYDEEPKCD